jgi:phosphoribosylformimino-5-aminoimidazole carboxamide ribotide isomerase
MTTTTTFEILPAIDLRGGQVVRLEEGDFERETAFGADPTTVAEGFATDGARWLHVVDLDAARSGVAAHADAIGRILASVGERVAVEVAGGLRTPAAVASVLEAGATRAVVGTAAIRDPGFAGRLIAAHGPDRIVVAIDIRAGRAVGDGWSTADPGVDALETLARLADQGVTTFEVTAIERDGLLAGPNLDLYERLVALGRGSIIASGGVATLADVTQIRSTGCRGVIVGRAIYEGRLSLRDAVAIAAAITLPG